MKRVLNGPAMLHSTTPAANHGPTQFRLIRVLLLDKKELFVKVENKNARVRQIFEEVCTHLNLKETNLFGLALLRDNEYFFVLPDVKLQKLSPKMWSQKEGPGDEPCLTFLFKVIFYVDNVRLLKYRTTRHLYYLQLKENFLTYNLCISEEKCFLLSSYALISDHGQYKPELHNNNNYFRPEDYLPSWVIMRRGLDYLSANLPGMHRDMSSEALSRDARLMFISELSTPPCCHNFHMYKLTKKKYDETDNFSLAIGPRGLDIYENSSGFLRSSISFLWPSFTKFNCDRKKFELTCGGGNNETKLSCFARSKEWCIHLRFLCKETQKFEQSIHSRLAELRHQEDRDAGWWPEKYVPSEDFSRGGSSGSDNSKRPQTPLRIIGNGWNSKQVFVDDMVANNYMTSTDNDSEPNGDVASNGEVASNGDVESYGGMFGNGIISERRRNVCTSLKNLEAPEVNAEARTAEISQPDINLCESNEDPEMPTPEDEAIVNRPIISIGSQRESHATQISLEDLNFDDLNLIDSEILIDTPPNSDSQNLTTITPLSSNLSPFDQFTIRSSTPKNTTTNVYRHTSYLGTPLSPYLYNPQQQSQRRQHQPNQGAPHQHPIITRHPTSGSGHQSLLWRASCSGRLMKRHLRSLECGPVHSTEHIQKLVPLQGYFGHCMYKSTPLSVYNMPVYHQSSVNNINYSLENESGMANQALRKNSVEENVRGVESDGSLEETCEMDRRPPPPPYEDAARNSKMRLAAGSGGLEFESDEFVTCDEFQSNQPTSSNANGSYTDFNWTTGTSSPKLVNQSQPPSILDYQFPLLDNADIEDDYCDPIIDNPVEQSCQQEQHSLEFQSSDQLLADRRFHLHRSSLNSYEQWRQQQQQQHHHHLQYHHLQAYQVQPQMIKAVSPLYAEQVQLSTPLLNRKNLQVFDQPQCNASPQDLRIPITKPLRKASSIESEPGEMTAKERGRGKPVQRHHSNITYLRDYKNADEFSKLSFPLVNALLKDPSLQQNVRSFPSNLAALVCDGEQPQT